MIKHLIVTVIRLALYFFQVPINLSSDTNKFRLKRQSADVSRLEILKLTKEDSGVYSCEAAFRLGSSKRRFEVKVLSIMAPLKPFIAVVAEVVILVTTIALYEVYSKRKGEGKFWWVFFV